MLAQGFERSYVLLAAGGDLEAEGFHRFLVALGMVLFAPLAHADRVANAPAYYPGLDRADQKRHGRLGDTDPERNIVAALLGDQAGLLNLQTGIPQTDTALTPDRSFAAEAKRLSAEHAPGSEVGDLG